jgi:hypothetical protein
MPAIREIKGDSDMPAMTDDNPITIGRPPMWMIQCSHNRGVSTTQDRDTFNSCVSAMGASLFCGVPNLAARSDNQASPGPVPGLKTIPNPHSTADSVNTVTSVPAFFLRGGESHFVHTCMRGHDLPVVMKLLEVHGGVPHHRLFGIRKRDRPPGEG